MKSKNKYLFIDIECCNGYNICSFGYCLVNEKLQITEKKDILINPEKKFNLPKAVKRNIQLAYPTELFYKQNNFSYYYKFLKKMLEKKNIVILGHSIKSDLLFLSFACKRYHLPQFAIEAYDTQKIFQKNFSRQRIESLEHILDFLEIDNSLTFHKSCDDAKASFLIAKEICWRLNCSMDELLINNFDCKITLDEK